jgi:hypothetical protein
MTTYKISRVFFDDKKARVIKRGLSLVDAKAHCQDKSTERRNKKGELLWFECFTVEDD